MRCNPPIRIIAKIDDVLLVITLTLKGITGW